MPVLESRSAGQPYRRGEVVGVLLTVTVTTLSCDLEVMVTGQSFASGSPRQTSNRGLFAGS